MRRIITESKKALSIKQAVSFTACLSEAYFSKMTLIKIARIIRRRVKAFFFSSKFWQVTSVNQASSSDLNKVFMLFGNIN